MIYASTTFGFVRLFFHGVFLHSRVTGACPVTTDLIMRVNVRTATTTTAVTTTQQQQQQQQQQQELLKRLRASETKMMHPYCNVSVPQR